MKLQLLWSVLCISILMILMSCDKEENKPTPEPAPWIGCVVIKNIETGEPIENVEVWWLWACCCQDMEITDSTGTVCGMNEQVGDCSVATFIHSEYITETLEMLPMELQMQKKAYIKFNFNNIAPSSPTDTLILNVQQGNIIAQQSYIGVGPFLDEIKVADPRHSDYSYYANGQWITVPVSLTSGDTTEVWLNF